MKTKSLRQVSEKLGASRAVVALRAALIVLFLTTPATAATRTWIGMNNKWNANDDNWNPADEPDANDAAILNGNFSVTLTNANESIGGLALSGGFDLDINGNEMRVGGIASLSGSSAHLFIGPLGAQVIAQEIAVNNGATLAMRGGEAAIDEETPDGALHIEVGGTMSGHGVFSTIYPVPSATRVLINDGTLTATSTATDVAGSTASTLSLNAGGSGDARVDLDGSSETGVVSVARNDTLDVNVPLSDPFSSTIVLHAGATLDIAADWILNSGSIIPNTAGITPGTAGLMATIAGGTFTQSAGLINLDANDTLRVACEYRAIGGSIVINGGMLILDGGGVIDSGAVLSLQNGGTLQGFGVINANLSGGGEEAEQVLADNGVLTVALDNGFLGLVMGTADADGVLEIVPAWHTSPTESVNLAGGELRGGEITNDSATGIHGHGLISARLINNSKIVAEGGGTLVIGNASNNNDWDGTANAGILEANAANLELLDDGTSSFGGQLTLGLGRQFFANGFGLIFQSTSVVTLGSGSRFESTNDTLISGTTTVASGGAILQGTFDVLFESTSQAALHGKLVLDSGLTVVTPGASFSGGGALVNSAGRTLLLSDGTTNADLAVTIINEGALRIEQLGSSGTAAQVQGVDYEQTATGMWRVNLGGVGLTAFDRFTLTGAAALAGGLDLTLIDGFVPTLGQTFNILSAAGGVSGVFDLVDQPPDMPAGLQFSVAYFPTVVQLQVTAAPLFGADFDGDGDVDGDDLVQWRGDYGLNADSNADGDGDSDGADFLAWQRQLGDDSTIPSSGAVPEPSAFQIALTTMAWSYALRRRRDHASYFP